ncbi:translationally-controlled tumor protein homolog [Procambarus clarkii]|uniref:translationally-controlled tumor protein homolog n=1 Tax=Procambarus clarkii TaxID=6728 RepID=UPI003742AC00
MAEVTVRGASVTCLFTRCGKTREGRSFRALPQRAAHLRPRSSVSTALHPPTMKVFKDLVTGDEMFTDTYKYEVIEDAFYMVIGKSITMSDDNIALDGANPSAEEVDEGTESNAVSGIDVVLYMRLQETGFGSKKDYLVYMKDYLKKLKGKLEGTPGADKLVAIQKPLNDILKKFKDLQFFTGESMNPEGMVAIGDYKDIDGEERPVFYFPKYGLEEEKL